MGIGPRDDPLLYPDYVRVQASLPQFDYTSVSQMADSGRVPRPMDCPSGTRRSATRLCP